jgi:amino acid transporter
VVIGEVEGPFAVPVPQSQKESVLKAEELNLFDSTAVAVSSVAPTYSLATTIVFLFTTVGIGYFGPAVIEISFVPVVFIAIAYFHLNRRDPDCGASYSWLSKFLSPYVGWFNGWVQVAASTLFCVLAPVTAAQNTLQLFNKEGWISASTQDNLWIQAFVAAVWLVFVTIVCILGIRYTTNLQWMLVIIEYVCVLGFSIWGILKVAVSHPAHTAGFQMAWINPLSIKSFTALAAGLVLGVFFFWGWDTAVNLNEESKNSSKIPGQAGVISMFLLLLIFVINIVAVQMWIPKGTFTNLYNSGNVTTVMTIFATKAIGPWAYYVMLIAVLSSTVATTQTTLLPAARITLSMARDKVWPSIFKIIDPKRLNPVVGTLIIALVALVGIFFTQGNSSVYNVFQKMVNNIGVLIGFYYGMAGIVCAWAYRRVAFKKFSFFFTGFLLPLASGIMLLWVGYQVVSSSGLKASVPILITLAIGIPLVIVARLMTKGNFFKTKAVVFDTIEHETEVGTANKG